LARSLLHKAMNSIETFKIGRVMSINKKAKVLILFNLLPIILKNDR